MKEDFKNIILMGLGAMSLTTEKAQEMKKELLKKGEEVYEKGKVANEELKHNIEEKIKELSDEDKKEIMDLLKDKK